MHLLCYTQTCTHPYASISTHYFVHTHVHAFTVTLSVYFLKQSGVTQTHTHTCTNIIKMHYFVVHVGHQYNNYAYTHMHVLCHTLSAHFLRYSDTVTGTHTKHITPALTSVMSFPAPLWLCF